MEFMSWPAIVAEGSLSHRTFFQTVVLGPGDGPLPLWLSLAWNIALVAVPMLVLVLLIAMVGIWAERKVAGHMQARIGPNRVGPFGILQSLADGIKLLIKEDLMPAVSDKLLFRLAPYLAFAPVYAAFVALPFGPQMTFEPRLNVGVFYVLAVLSVEVMGVILAGWASNNKWAIYGAMREACQMVSYEIPLGIAIIVAVMAAGTLNMVELGLMQGGGLHTWLIFRNPFVFMAFLIYFIASLASNKRAPFDLPESESELVAGFHTEYSGLRWAFFFFAEYAAMFVVGGIQAALFLGGWNDPFGLIGYYHQRFTAEGGHQMGLVVLNLLAAGIFIAKASLIIFIQMWLRWTLPRPRIDQVLHACIKVLLPASCAMMLGASLWQLFVVDPAGVPWRDFQPLSAASWTGAGSAASLVAVIVLTLVGLGICGAVTVWVGYALVTGRRHKQRLTDPAPIHRAPEVA
jgi:NADH-quinone oxidoreductase subunit H